MAIQRTDSNTQAVNTNQTTGQQQQYPNNNNNRQRKEADGWLNLKVKTASGEFITVPCRIALDLDNPVHQGMLNKHKSDPDFVFEIQGTIGIKSTEVPTF